MELLDEYLLLSASDLINFLECEHLTALDLEKAHGRLDSDPKRPDTADLVTQKGEEHEQRYLESLREQHDEALVEIETDGGYRGLLAAAQATGGRDACRRAHDLPGDLRARQLAWPCRLP